MRLVHIFGTIAAILVLAEYGTCASSMLPKPARKPWPAGLYPDIERDLAGCGRLTPNSLLCDPDQLISTEQADQVEDQLLDIAVPTDPHPSAACHASGGRHERLFHGYEVGLALADILENRFGRKKRVAGADFTFQLFHKWGLGRECQSGMLIVVEHSVSQVYIYVAPGMAALLNEDRVQALIHQMEQDLSQGLLMQALQAGANMTSAMVRGEVKVKHSNVGPTEATAILLGLVGLILITAVRCCRGTRPRE